MKGGRSTPVRIPNVQGAHYLLSARWAARVAFASGGACPYKPGDFRKSA